MVIHGTEGRPARSAGQPVPPAEQHGYLHLAHKRERGGKCLGSVCTPHPFTSAAPGTLTQLTFSGRSAAALVLAGR